MDKKNKNKSGSLTEEGLIKASIHSLDQKFGKSPICGQLSIFDNLENRELVQEAKNLNIKILGWDLTRAEDQAVFAIQKIYSKYGYKGNVNGDKNNSLIFNLPEFYKSYGVLKYKYKGKESFSGAEKNQAYAALINLTKKQCIVAYSQLDMEATKKKKMQIFNRIETLSAIIPVIDFLYTDLSKKEETGLDDEKHKTEKLRAIKITPSKVFLNQIGNYYALLPYNLYIEIKEKLPKTKNIHLPMFIQWLAKEIALRRRKNLSNTLEISFEKLSYTLRMDSWIKSNRKKMINDRLMECFKQTKFLGYLKDYKITKGKTVPKKATLYININKFKSQEKIEEIIFDNNPKEEDYTYKPLSKEFKKETYEMLAKFSPKYKKKLDEMKADF